MENSKNYAIIAVILGIIGFIFIVDLYPFLVEDERDDSKATISGFADSVEYVEWSPDGERIASISWKQIEGNRTYQLSIWNHSTLKLETAIEEDNKLEYWGPLSWSPDGYLLAVGCVDYNDAIMTEFGLMGWPFIQIINTTTWEPMENLTGNFTFVHSLDWSWDGRFLAATDSFFMSHDKSNLVIWEIETWRNVTIPRQPRINMLKWSPSSYALATAHEDHTVRIYNSNGIPLIVLRGHNDSVECVDWSPDGEYLASGSGYEIIIWETRFWTQHATILDPSGDEYTGISEIQWNADSSLLASRDINDRWIMIWSLNKTKKMKVLVGHDSTVNSISWSHQNALIASASSDGTIKIWEV